VVDVREELMKFRLLTRGRQDYPVDLYFERKDREPGRLKAIADVGFAERWRTSRIDVAGPPQIAWPPR